VAPTSPRPTPPAAAPSALLLQQAGAALGALPSCLIVKDGETEVASRAPDVPLAPASTQKLLVAAAALDVLGLGFRFDTVVKAVGPPRDGSVDALWLVGSGDPLLATSEYGAWLGRRPRTRDVPTTPLGVLADALVAKGVRAVQGEVHGDDSRFDRLRYLASWDPKFRTENDIGPLGALTVNGGFEQWEGRAVVAPDPAAHAASELARLLRDRGAAAAGGDDQPAPAAAVVLAHLVSPPLADIVTEMLRTSDNLAAELLTRELDRRAGGSGTTAGGTAAVVAAAARLGLPASGLVLVDGSGLDGGDRATCRLLLAALDLGARPGFEPLARGLAVAGQPGTLVHRWVGTPLAGRLAAKTGWTSTAAGMVGVLPGGHRLRFAFLANGPLPWPAAQGVEDRLVAALAAYAGVA
jgi:D-alanyl-D-alanine carboxypeptidase/D-alanyl-D-alanine-endopeptidase (penicillin-binding protein 4)